MSTLSGIAPKGEKGRPKFQSLNINTLYRGESLETHQQKNVQHQRKHGMQNLGKIPAARRAPANLPSIKSEHSGNDPAYSLVPTGGSGWGSKPGETGPPPTPSTTPPSSTTGTPVQSSVSPSSQNSSNAAAGASAAVAAAAAAAAVSAVAAGAAGQRPPVAATASAAASSPASSSAAPVLSPGQQLPPPVASSPAQQPQHQQQQPPHPLAVPFAAVGSHDKSWSAITSTSGGDAVPSFLAHQSPHFQAQFPLLPGETPPGGSSSSTSMSSKTDLTNPFGPGGPSLRPQTEGSWSQGGRPPPSSSNNSNQGQASQMGSVAGSQTQGSAAAQGHLPTGPDLGVMRNNSGQYGVGGGQGGPQQPNPHIMSQLRGVLPPFMLRHAGPFSPSFQGGPGPVHGPSRPRYPYMPDSRMMGVPRPSPGQDPDELTQRPIIKEEDLNRMDDIARDTGWATQDDIDYNQKLAFSDDETNADDDSPSAQKQQHQRNKQSPAVGGRQAPVDDTDRERDRDRDQRPSQQQQQQQRADVMEQQRRDEEDRRSADKAEQRGGPTRQHGGRPSPGSDYHGGPPPNMVAGGGGFATQPLMRNSVQGGRMATDEDELRREELAIAVEQAKQRAKQRKEVEEKRYEETKQAAAKKLLELNEKSMKNSSNSSSAAQHNTAAEGPLEAADEWAGPGPAPPPFRPNRKPADGPSFGQMTQISRRDYVGRALSDRDRERDRERDRDRDRDRDWERDRDRDRQRDRERDRDRDRDRDGDRDRDWGDKDRERERDRDLRPEREVGGGGHSGVATFSKAFKLPPRFQKQQQEQQQQRYFHQQSSRSSGGSGGASAGLRGRNRTESELSSDRERDEDRRGGGERERDRHTPDNYDGGRATNDAYAPSRGGDNSQRQPPPQQQQPPRDRDRAPGYGGKPTSGGGGSGGYYNGTNEFGGNSRGGGGYGGRNHDYESRSDWNDADREQRWDKKMDRERSRGGDRDHKDSYFYDSHRESDNKKSNDGYKLHGNQSSHQQQDTFDERDRDHQPGPPPRSSLEGDWRGERDRDTSSSEQSGGRDRRERPQRPDSRDSRASRDSRNSRDSIREESNRLASQSDSMLQGDWNDNCSYEQSVREDSRPMMRRKESRDEKRDMHSSYMPQRPIPGPITKEKLEASESRSEMKRSNLIQLGKKTDQSKQKNEADRKQSVTNDGSSDAWSRASSAHAAANEAPRMTSPGNAHAPVSDGGHHQSWADVTDDQPPQHRSAGPASSASSTSIHLDHQDNKIGIGNAKDDADTLQADNAHVGGDGASTDKQSHQQPPLSNQQKTDNQELTSIKKSDDLESNMNHRPVAAGAANDQNKNRGGGSNRSGGGSSWGGSFKTSQWSSQRGVGSGSESRGGGGRRGGGGGGRGGGGGPRSQQRNWTSGAGPNSDVSDGSADEVSASAESSKDDKDRSNRRNAPRSPKQSNRRNDNKDEKSNRDRDNRERDAKRDGGGNEKIASGGDGGGRRMDSKRSGYEGGPRSSGMGGGGGREGFVPRGEPSRFGRGMHHGGGGGRSAGGGNMTYGPPSSGKFQSKDAIDKDKPTKEEEQHNDIDKAKTSNQGPPSSAIGSRQVGGSKTSSQVDSSSRYQSRGAKENDQRRGGGGDPRKTRGGGRGRQSQAPGGGGQDGGDDDEVWEETMSEEGEGEREDGGGKQVDTRQQRNYHSSRTSSGRGARRTEGRRGGGAGGGDKRSYDRSGSDSRAANQQPQVINGRVGGGGGKGSKDSADKSSSNESALSDATNRRTDSNKDKNNLDGIDLLSSSVVVVDDQPEGAYEEDGSLFAADSGAGFNEVRNKKNAKQQRQQQQQLTNQKSADEKSGGGTNREQRGGGGGKNERFKSNKVYGGGNSNSPTPQDGPKADGRSSMRGGGGQNRESQSGGGSGKSYGNRNKKQMIPRFHQQANQQQQQQQAAYDVNEMNKINQNVSMFNVKDVSAAAPPAVNAWDKPITSSILLDTRVQMAAIGFNKTEANSNVIVDNCVEIGDHGQSGGSSQRSSPGGMSGQTSEKMLNKLSREAIEKSAVDGSTPVPSLIFENTNLKGNTDPGKLKFKNPRIDKNRDRKLDGIEDNSSMGGLGGYKPATASGVEMLNQDASGNSKPDPIQMPMSFAKNQEDSADFCADKLDFFDSELSQLTADTADKPTSSSSSQSCKSATMQLMQRTHQQHAALQQLSAPSSTAELNLKIQSVKKVWDGPGPVGSVMDHHGEDGGGVVSSAPAFTTTFGNAVDDSPHYQVKSVDNVGNVVSNDPDGPGGTEIVYSVSQCHAVSGGVNSYVNAQNMMKPDAINSVSSNVCKLIDPQVKPQPAGVTAMSASATHALSPPPALTSGYSSNTQQPNSHIFQYAGGMSGIPSPPTVVYNTSQPIQGQTTEMYQPTFQLSSAPVLGQSRSQFSPFPPYSLTNQSLYFPTAAPPPPSSAGPPPPADMFQPAHSSMHQPSPYQQMGRQMGPPPATPFGPSSHSNMNSSSTGQLLISSATGSGHMPPVVPKQAPPQQPIGTIGTKPYQPTANPMFVYESMPFMSSSLLQRSTAAVGAQMQAAAAAAASNSYYSAAATAGVPPAGPPPPQPQSGSFYNPAAANANSSQTLHQQQYSAATVQFGQSQNASAANPPVGMQNYGSQLFRQQAPSSYLKSSSLAQQHVGNDPSKSPSANQSDVMNSVFQASQMQSPKSRPAGTVGKQACQPQQPSPTQSHHKYNTAYQVMQQQVAVAQQQHVAAAAAAQQQRNSAAAVAAAQMGGRPGGQVGVPPPTQQQVPPPTRYNPTIQPPIQRPPANYQVVKMQQQMNNANNNNGNLQQQQHHHNNNGRLPPPQNRHPQQQGRPGGPPPPTAYVTKMTPNNANSYYPGQPGGGVKMDSSGSVMESKTDQVCKMPDNAASKSQTGLADLPKDDNATVTAD